MKFIMVLHEIIQSHSIAPRPISLPSPTCPWARHGCEQEGTYSFSRWNRVLSGPSTEMIKKNGRLRNGSKSSKVLRSVVT